MIDKEFMDNLRPVDIDFISEYLMDKFGKQLVFENSDNYKEEAECCPRCRSHKIIKWGSKPKQRYKCKDCNRTFSNTTGTVFFGSHQSYEKWTKFIMAELCGTSLRDEMEMMDTCIETVFIMRHKLYDAVKDYGENILFGLIEADSTYKRISYCGLRKYQMPRESHKRGKHKSEKGSSGNQGNYNDKICIVSAVDERDNCILKTASSGRENSDDFHLLGQYFKQGSTVVCDSNSTFIKYCKDNGYQTDVVIPKPTYNNYITESGNSLSSVNQLHQEVSLMIQKTHGVSIRHLQGYLNWILFKRFMRFKVERKYWKSESYKKIMNKSSEINSFNIHNLPFPIHVKYELEDLIPSVA